MWLNEFSINVPEGKEVSGGYVEMEHGRKYTLRLRNSRSVRCDAHVEVDGKDVGSWRIDPKSSIHLEHPAGDQGCFTFYKVGTPEAEKAQLDSGNCELGLIKVTFSPEKIRPANVIYEYDPVIIRRRRRPIIIDEYDPWYPRYPWESPIQCNFNNSVIKGSCSFSTVDSTLTSNTAGPYVSFVSTNYSSGGTGLSGKSDQQYGSAYSIEYDESQRTIIYLRLVAAEKKSYDEPRPLLSRSNPIPPRVD